MFEICIPYRPDPEEVRPIKTEVCHYIRSMVPGKDLFTFWSWAGKWVLAVRLREGQIMEIGDLQGMADQPPTCTRSFVESIIRMFRAGDKNRGPVAKAMRARQSKRLSELTKFQEQSIERRRMYRKHSTSIHADHPYFKV